MSYDIAVVCGDPEAGLFKSLIQEYPWSDHPSTWSEWCTEEVPELLDGLANEIGEAPKDWPLIKKFESGEKYDGYREALEEMDNCYYCPLEDWELVLKRLKEMGQIDRDI